MDGQTTFVLGCIGSGGLASMGLVRNPLQLLKQPVFVKSRIITIKSIRIEKKLT